jgi:Spy/CpxP family protein refolding chaperone
MKRILTGLLVGFLVLVFASQYSSAQTCGMGGGFPEEGVPMMSPMRHDGMGMMRREHHLWRTLMGLGLDEKQKEAIKEIKSRVMKDTVRKRADIEVARIDLRDLLGKDQVDMNAAEATLKKIASLQTDVRISHIKAMQEIKTKLTPEQRKKFKEMLEMGPHAEKMMHGGMQMTPLAENNEGALQEKEQ